MPPKQIRLKSTISSINSKISAKQKKVQPKLKVILANPYKPKHEILSESELSHLKESISFDIKSSEVQGRQFARQSNIQLGLGSSLRAIRNNKASCVLVSQSIKPKFIIDQIVVFARQTNSSVPVFIVDDLDKVSVTVFGVKALVVAFPIGISGKLGKWLSSKQIVGNNEKPIEMVEMNTAKKPPAMDSDIKCNLNSIYLLKPSDGTRSFVPDVVVKSELLPQKEETKDWTGDFISLSTTHEETLDETTQMDTDDVDEEFKRKHDKTLEALQKIANRIRKSEDNDPPKVKAIKILKEDKPKGFLHKKASNTESEEWENDASYISLQVHKIQPNPKRKPKKKRKNKKVP